MLKLNDKTYHGRHLPKIITGRWRHFCFRQERKQQYLDPTGFDTSLSSETGRTYSTKQSFAMTVIPELILTDRALLI